jgi:hypothetical protein
MIERRITSRLLGRNVRRRSQAHANLRDAHDGRFVLGRRRADQRLADTKVEYDRLAVKEHHVLRLDVAMHDAFAVRILQRTRHLLENGRNVGKRHGSLTVHALAQGFSIDERHRVVQMRSCDARREQGHDVRMLQARGQPDLPLEPLSRQRCGQLRCQHLDDDLASPSCRTSLDKTCLKAMLQCAICDRNREVRLAPVPLGPDRIAFYLSCTISGPRKLPSICSLSPL